MTTVAVKSLFTLESSCGQASVSSRNSSIVVDFLTGDVKGEMIGGGISTSLMILDTSFTGTVSSRVSMASLLSEISGDSVISGTFDTSVDGDEDVSGEDDAGGEEFLFSSRNFWSLRPSRFRSLGDFFFFFFPGT